MEIAARSAFNEVDRIVLFPAESEGCARRTPGERDACGPLDFTLEVGDCP